MLFRKFMVTVFIIWLTPNKFLSAGLLVVIRIHFRKHLSFALEYIIISILFRSLNTHHYLFLTKHFCHHLFYIFIIHSIFQLMTIDFLIFYASKKYWLDLLIDYLYKRLIILYINYFLEWLLLTYVDFTMWFH